MTGRWPSSRGRADALVGSGDGIVYGEYDLRTILYDYVDVKSGREYAISKPMCHFRARPIRYPTIPFLSRCTSSEF